MSFPSKAATARIGYKGFKGVQNEGAAKEEQTFVRSSMPLPGQPGIPTVVKSMPALYSKDGDDTGDAITVVKTVEKTVEKEVKKKTNSHSERGRDYQGHHRDRNDRNDRKKEEKKDRTRDKSRSPVGRKGSREGIIKPRDDMGVGFNRGGRKQQGKAKEDEMEKPAPPAPPAPTVRERGKWEGFGWSSRNRGEELGQVSDDSDD